MTRGDRLYFDSIAVHFGQDSSPGWPAASRCSPTRWGSPHLLEQTKYPLAIAQSFSKKLHYTTPP
jgi:hypothetical protein